MLRLILFGIFFILLFFDHQKIHAELYGQSSGRIRSSAVNVGPYNFKSHAQQQYKLVRTRDRSPTFIQSRHFHPDQLARDNRDLGRPFAYQSQLFSSAYYPSSGIGTNLYPSNQEACRLTTSFCSRDYQCCSGKCRCVKWSVMGKMSCWKKCF